MIENPSEFTMFAKKLARSSGAILMQYHEKEDLKFERKSFNDIATEGDIASEKNLVKMIQDKYPDHSILAEESGKYDKDSKYKWIIDPLDGTTNFNNGLPIFAVSVGFEVDGEIESGAVFNPYTNEMFFAEKGRGAYLNGEPIHVSDNNQVEFSLFSTGFTTDPETTDKNLKIFCHLTAEGFTIRRYGAAAIDLSYVACGRFDGFWEYNLKPWDLAAGSLIVNEAGGKITAVGGEPVDIYSRESILASNGKLHDKMNSTIAASLK